MRARLVVFLVSTLVVLSPIAAHAQTPQTEPTEAESLDQEIDLVTKRITLLTKQRDELEAQKALDEVQSGSPSTDQLTVLKALLEAQTGVINVQKAKVEAEQQLFQKYIPAGESTGKEGELTVAGVTIESQVSVFQQIQKFALEISRELRNQDPDGLYYIVSTTDLVDQVNNYNLVFKQIQQLIEGLNALQVPGQESAGAILPLVPKLFTGVLSAIADSTKFFRKDTTLATTDLSVDVDLVVAELSRQFDNSRKVYHPAQQGLITNNSLILPLIRDLTGRLRLLQIDWAKVKQDDSPEKQLKKEMILELREELKTLDGNSVTLLALVQAEQLNEILSQSPARILHINIQRATVQNTTTNSVWSGTRIDTKTAVFGSYAAYDRQGVLQASGAVVSAQPQ